MKFDFPSNPNSFLYPFGQIRLLQELRFSFFSQEERWTKVLGSQSNSHLIDVLAFPKIEHLNNFSYHLDSIFTFKNAVDVLGKLGELIKIDFELLKKEERSQPVNLNSKIYKQENIYFGTNVTLRNCTLNAENGPILIGDNVQVMEYAVIYGPAVINSNTIIAPHGFLRSNTVVGKNCYVGGEIKNSLIMSNSNKGHYGYLGDSIIGEYCNLGAGTTTSNLKNNFSNIKMYAVENEDFIDSGLSKLGSLIGDFSMTAINTSLNAGTTIGVHCNVFGENKISSKYSSNFSWGEQEKYQSDKWQETAKKLLLHKGADQKEIKNIIGKLDTLYKKSIITL